MVKQKKIIQAVAGSGKTTLLINKLKETKENVVIITFTINNQEEIKNKVIETFNGSIPSNIHIFRFFQFLYSFCVTPFMKERPKGINFDRLPNQPYNQNIYKDINNRFYKDRISKAVLEKKEEIKYISRVDRYFSKVFIDEVQDFASDDLDWLLSLNECDAEILCVGDFYQSTFQTSARGNKNKGVKQNYDKYKKKFVDHGFKFDDMVLSKSIRCSEPTCRFIRKNLGINIYSYEKNQSDYPQLITKPDHISKIWNDDNIIKLFYQKSTDYNCSNCLNWAESKGITRKDVCIILTKNLESMVKNEDFTSISPVTKSKFYVACTRASNNVYFISSSQVKKYKK
ncbi:UvrD-helicase domain-containing protein [Staphylococcus simulans]|uniref:UvrD-helicase domain-containing protein n=1 Tax=Staphylococcus simulans TaxID=1286 RepID=UPI0027F5250C|nr:UvrD-helicase domain-containing protein [Staphylococcus simulans]MDQ7111951.1 AAA family ATPase [Staphylococcus simulans]MDQ7117563.1 AAA family ATPase [Staphylococcus simulans]